MTDPNGVKIIQQQQKAAQNPAGGFVEYVWFKLGSSKPTPKISFVRSIPDWGWTIGAGVYLDSIKQVLAKNESALRLKLVRKILASVCVLFVLIAMIFLLGKRVAGKTGKSIQTFESFFERAVSESVNIPTGDMAFRELFRIAKSANMMIHAQKRSEKALRDSEKRFRELFDNMSSGVAIYDSPDDGQSFVFLNLNRSGLENTRKTKDEVVGREVREVFPGVEALGLFDVFKRVWKTGIPEHHPSSTYQDGKITLWVENYVCKLPSGELVAIYEDTTARMQAESALQENEKFLETLIENIPDMIFVKDAAELRFVRLNKAGEELLGYSREEMVGKNDYDFFPKEDADFFTKKDREVLSRGNMLDIPEEPVQTKNKGERILHTKKIPLLNEQGNPVYLLGISEDTTDYKQFEEQLRQAQKMESIGNLAGGIAHDFNNILFPIIGMSEMLLEDLPPGSLEHENVQEIFQAGKRGRDLVQQILAFSRQSEHQLIPVRIQMVLKEVLKLLRSTIPTNIEIIQNIDANCGKVMADPTQVHQIAMNLITNAYHAVEGSDGTITVGLQEIRLHHSETTGKGLGAGRYAMLTVSDNGIGIDPSVMEKIFDPYFTTKEQGKGTGLGLAVAYGIAKEFGGDIKVSSEPGKGASFKVYFPLIDKKTAPDIMDTVSPLQTGNESILLVDDEASVANLEKQMLERLGYRVTARTSSPDALEAFMANPSAFDLIISDLSMSNMTGDRLAQEIIAIRPEIPIIICTGFSENISLEKASAVGIKGFLMKPIVKADLAQMVRKVLDNA